ncbi:MAG TPA: hypothetical protein VHL31_13205 [Geminicoccus sp.]|jgi:hypothetical protein|uniref:hypothetical protein n=1 Tax=Geminicoccus sp. TaxID=2024832 RepID=UPI002E3737B4|nr:hypothetical protein [Geminicoccus sp.]HEX2527239.1 hypothetical protein [Geminicoccus sp.]
MWLAGWIVEAVRVYGAVGLAVAVVFLLHGIDRIDPSAQRAYAVRALLLPGVVLLWPVVLMRWHAALRAG